MDIHNIFSYHPPQGDESKRYEAIRAAAETFAQVVIENTPICADQTSSIRKLRDAVMWANAAIALKGQL